jgi:hypothetical protein
MSFDSYLEIVSIDATDLELEEYKPAILKFLDEHGIDHSAYVALQSAFTNSRAHFRVHSQYLYVLLRQVAPLFPDFDFDARGLGEEFRHTWICEFRGGQPTYVQGPWDYE